MTRLTKYEKETIILTSEGADFYSVYPFNLALKRRLGDFSKKHPEYCRLEAEENTIGSQSYDIGKNKLAIRLTAPYSDKRRRVDRGKVKSTWLKLK